MTKGWQPPAYRPGRVISLDISLQATGYAILDTEGGFCRMAEHTGKHLPFGTISPPEGMPPQKRRNHILRTIRNLARAFKPQYFVYEGIEGTLFHKSAAGQSNYTWNMNALKLIGAVEGIADERRCPCYSITPIEWKNHFNIPMGKKAEGLDPKMIAIETAKKEFGLSRIAEDPAEAALQAKALLERRNLCKSGQLRFL